MLDRILDGLVDDEMSVAEVVARDRRGPSVVADIESKLLRAEYKRRQAPPGVKLGQPQLRPRPPLPDHQRLPHRPQ